MHDMTERFCMICYGKMSYLGMAGQERGIRGKEGARCLTGWGVGTGQYNSRMLHKNSRRGNLHAGLHLQYLASQHNTSTAPTPTAEPARKHPHRVSGPELLRRSMQRLCRAEHGLWCCLIGTRLSPCPPI